MIIIRKLEECKNNAAEELHKALSIYSLKMDSQARQGGPQHSKKTTQKSWKRCRKFEEDWRISNWHWKINFCKRSTVAFLFSLLSSTQLLYLWVLILLGKHSPSLERWRAQTAKRGSQIWLTQRKDHQLKWQQKPFPNRSGWSGTLFCFHVTVF